MQYHISVLPEFKVDNKTSYLEESELSKVMGSLGLF
jgi:hypothetical protein